MIYFIKHKIHVTYALKCCLHVKIFLINMLINDMSMLNVCSVLVVCEGPSKPARYPALPCVKTHQYGRREG